MARSDAPTPIDPRGPRTNQAVLTAGLALGLVVGVEWVAPVFAVVLFLGAAFGPRYGPVLRVYADVVRPRLAPPAELEDPRPPRFSAWVGTAFLAAATAAFVAGAATVGWVLVGVVALLAGLAAVTGLCVGCEVYVWLVRLRARLRSAGGQVHDRGMPVGGLPDLPVELRAGRAQWVVFRTEYCAVCPGVVAELEQTRPDDAVTVLDVAEHPALAATYRVRRAPTVLQAAADGRVLARLSGADAVRAELGASAAV